MADARDWSACAWPLSTDARQQLVRIRVGQQGPVGEAELAPAIAGRAREIAVAVNPFDLHTALFRLPAAAFPHYTSWTAHTRVLHLVWLALVLSAIAFATVRPRVR